MSGIQEPSVREMAGVYGNAGAKDNQWVQLYEHRSTVLVKINFSDAYLSISEARKLARQLNRLAKRIEDRLPVAPVDDEGNSD